MKIYVILFTVIWSQMTDGFIRGSSCVDGENQIVTNQKQCESCSCENISTNDVCSLEFCPCLKILCSQSSKLEDLSQKDGVYNRNNSDIEITNDWHKENTYKHNQQEREQNRSDSRYGRMGTTIRLLFIGYTTPVNESVTDLYTMLVILLYCTILAIGITICIIVYKKYGYDKREHRCTIDKQIQNHLMTNRDFKSDNQKATSLTKSLLNDPPPFYEKCVV